MTEESLLETIYAWLGEHFPDGPQWERPSFHCFGSCHPIIRSVAAMDSVEGEISNGAWGQLLWNTFPNWRTVLELAGDGYTLMGADAQAQAIPILAAKLATHELACAAAMHRAETGDFETEFGAFTAIGYTDTSFEEQLRFVGGDLEEKRRNWLEANRAVVLHVTMA